MKTLTKKLVTLTLAFCFLITPLALAVNAAESPTPRLNNTISTTTNMTITESGLLSIGYKYVGFPDVTTHAVITTYVQKRFLGVFWKRVDIGTENNEWVDTIYQEDYVGSRSFQLSDSGTYRVTVQYEIYGSGGAADVLDYQGTDSY